MNDDDLAERFERERSALTKLALRLLGSRSEAEDAVQEAWLRLATHASLVENLPGWLRTVVTRLCFDRLRSRGREQPMGDGESDIEQSTDQSPEAVAERADDVSRVLLVVLDTLSPEERVAFVVHEMFGMRYAEIAPLVGRTEEATKKLAGRARAKVRGEVRVSTADLVRHRDVVDRFLHAARAGDIDRILAVLAPDVIRTADVTAMPAGGSTVLRGARAVAEGTALLAERSRRAELALIDGDVGLAMIEDSHLVLAVRFAVSNGLIARYDVISNPRRLHELPIAIV